MKFTRYVYIEETQQFEISARRRENSEWYVIDSVNSESHAKQICMKLEDKHRLRSRYISIERVFDYEVLKGPTDRLSD